MRRSEQIAAITSAVPHLESQWKQLHDSASGVSNELIHEQFLAEADSLSRARRRQYDAGRCELLCASGCGRLAHTDSGIAVNFCCQACEVKHMDNSAPAGVL